MGGQWDGGVDSSEANFSNSNGPIVQFTFDCANSPPIAECQDITLSADDACEGTATAADVDFGSYDPDDDEITLSLAPQVRTHWVTPRSH